MFEISVDDFSDDIRDFINGTCAVRSNPTQYDPTPKLRYCYQATEKVIRIPLGLWADVYEEFPNDPGKHPVIPAKNFTCTVKLLSVETDPDKRGRDQNITIPQCIDQMRNNHVSFLALPTGQGKCLAPGTEVLMYDGSKKKVENIVETDILMGDDSTPRNVISICTGEEEMYEIVPTKGESFTVNKSHILTLKVSGQARLGINRNNPSKMHRVSWFDGNKCVSKSFSKIDEARDFSNDIMANIGDVFDIELTKYLNLTKEAKHILKCYWTPITYKHRKVPIDPRMIGMWLGDGHTSSSAFTNMDPEIFTYIEKFAKKNGLRTHYLTQEKTEALTCRISGIRKDGKHCNYFLTEMQKLGLIGKKHIPLIYKANSEKIRLELLAGLIDTDGYYCKGCYEIMQKSKTLAYDILDLCRSLGFGARIKERQKYCFYKGEKRFGTYYAIAFSGEGIDKIPVLLDRKKADVRRQKKNTLVTGFKIIPKGHGRYHGFCIDGNHRFVLGTHMVTHNTSCSVYISCQLRVKTMVLCHLDEVNKQWVETFERYTNCKVLRVKGKNFTPENVDKYDIFVCGVMKAAKLPIHLTKKIGFVVLDEAHITVEMSFTETLLRFKPIYLLGLSATPRRPDGLHRMFPLYFGSPEKFITRFEKKEFTVYKYETDFVPEIKYMFVMGQSTLDFNTFKNSIEYCVERQKAIVKICSNHKDRKILILSDRKQQTKGIYDELIAVGETATTLYGTDKTYDKNARVLVAGIKKAGVGFSDSSFDMLIMASSVKDVQQNEGRIRQTHNIIYDVVDKHPILENQWKIREKWYTKRGATIVIISRKNAVLQSATISSKRLL
jgi:hypothetical protein